MTRSNGRGADQPRTTMQFYGKAQGVKVNVPKSGYSSDSGSVDITFRIEAPKKPNDPFRYGNDQWKLNQAQQVLDGYGGERPDPKTDKKGAAEFDKAQKVVEFETNRIRTAKERYERELAAHAPALMSYAQLVGLMAVFSDQRLEITLAPADQDLLPGMGVTLALPNGQAAADEEDEDLEDYDEDDDFDEEELEAAEAQA